MKFIKKILSEILKYKYYILSFLIPFLFFLVFGLIYNKNFYDFFIGDAGIQYIYFFDYLKEVFSGKQSILYSFSFGLGTSTLATYYYYLSSPLNFLLILTPSKYIHILFVILCFFKIGIVGLNMFIYLKSTKKNNDIVYLILSCSYALMTYNIVYYFNIMWLDVIALAPIVIMGIDKIIDDDKNLLYIIFLALSIFSNFYIAYMLCIFCVIYFIYKLFIINKKKNSTFIKNKAILFIKSSMIAGLLCAFVIIPIFFYSKNFNRIDNYSNNINFFTLFDFLSQMGVKNFNNSSADYYLPYFHMNFIIFVIILNYLRYEQNNKKKIVTISILLIFIFSIIFYPLNLVWHGFSRPMGLCNRFVFLFDFFIIIICNNWYSKCKTIDKKTIIEISMIWAILFLSSTYFSNQNVSIFIFLSNLFFLVASFIIFNKKNNFLILIFIILQIVFNFKLIFITNYSFRENQKIASLNDREDFGKFLNNIDLNFYRFGADKGYLGNRNLSLNKGRIDLFLTTNNKNISKFLSNVGYHSVGPYNKDNENIYMINSLLGIKYWITENENINLYNKVDNKIFDEHNILKNNYALNMGFLVNNTTLNDDINPFEYQNNLFSSILGYSVNVYEKNKYVPLIENKSFMIETNYNEENYILIDFKNASNAAIDIFVDGILNEPLYKNSNKIVKLKINNSGKHIISLKGDINEIKRIYFYSTDKNYNQNLLTQIKTNEMKINSIKKNKLTGEINLKNNGTLMLSIPYEKGWIIKINGQKVNYQKIYDCFIGIELNKGKNEIEMIYFPKSLLIGIVISIITAIYTICYSVCKKL